MLHTYAVIIFGPTRLFAAGTLGLAELPNPFAEAGPSIHGIPDSRLLSCHTAKPVYEGVFL